MWDGLVARYWSIGDFDGDGVRDLFEYKTGEYGALVYIHGVAGFERNGIWTDAWDGGRNWFVGDFNGDGKDDIFSQKGDGSNITMHLSTGEKFSLSGNWNGVDLGFGDWIVGDFNGDGKDDIVRGLPGVAEAEVFLSDGTGFVAAGSWTAWGSGGDGWYVGDFDGDGRSDLLRYMPGVAGAEVLLSSGDGFMDGQIWTTVSHDGRWTIADLNGDGKDDLIDGAGKVLLSDGSRFSYVGNYDLPNGGVIFGADQAREGSGTKLIISVDGAEGIDGIEIHRIDTTQDLSPAFLEGVTGLPRLGLVGRPIDITLHGLGSGLEARVVLSGEQTIASDWVSSDHLIIDPTEVGIFSLIVQLRDKTTGDIVYESLSGRELNVLDIGQTEVLSSIERLRIEEVSSDISEIASARAWRSEVTTFQGLYDFVNNLYTESLADGTQQGQSPDQAKAFFFLQFVSGMWAYGNKDHPEIPGDVLNNSVSGVTPLDQVNANTFIQSVIGDCEDFAGMLSLLLTRAGFETRVLVNPAHALNEVLINGQWWTFDATLGLAIDQPFDVVLNRNSEPTVLSFQQAGRFEDSPLFRENLVEFLYEHLLFISAGVFPDAVRYAAIDYFKTLPYAAIFLDGLDLSDWTASPPQVFEDDPSFTDQLDLNQLIALAELDRLDLGEVRGNASALASDVEWRAGIGTPTQLFDAVGSVFVQQAGPHEDIDRALFYLQWVSGLWAWDPETQATGNNISEMLAAETMSPEYGTMVLGWLLEKAGFETSVALTEAGILTQVRIDDEWWTLDLLHGLAFEGQWDEVISSAGTPRVLVLPVAAQAGESTQYSRALTNASFDTLMRVASGLFTAGETVSFEHWLLQQPLGRLFLLDLDPLAPKLISIERVGSEIVKPVGSTSLVFAVTFSEQMAEVKPSDFHIQGTTGTITSIEWQNGAYLVTVSGGDLAEVRAPVRLTLADTNGLTDIATNPLAPLDAAISAEYLVGAQQGFSQPVVSPVEGASGGDHWYLGDFNNDGVTDLFRYIAGQSGADMWLSSDTGLVHAGSWTDAWDGHAGWQLGDFNGDGKDDLLRYVFGKSGADVFLSDGKKFEFAGSWTTAGNGASGWHLGDFNGDGKTDIFRYLAGSSGADVWLSTGSAFVRAGSWTSAWSPDSQWHLGDFNGDGKTDIFRYVYGESGADVFLSDGEKFVFDGGWTLAGNGSDGWYVADVNGDGLDDIFRHLPGKSGADVFLSTGTEFVRAGSWTSETVEGAPWQTGDFNGDGATDLFRVQHSSGALEILFSGWVFA